MSYFVLAGKERIRPIYPRDSELVYAVPVLGVYESHTFARKIVEFAQAFGIDVTGIHLTTDGQPDKGNKGNGA